MKQRTTAVIEYIEIEGQPLALPEKPSIDIELSAIDTGGGFRDPIIDFNYRLPLSNRNLSDQESYFIKLIITNPSNSTDTVSFSYDGMLHSLETESQIEGMGRLQDKQVNREMVTFILRCLR